MSFDELLAGLRAEYLKGFEAKIENLKMATQVKDLKKIEEIFHQLKGTGKTYGFEEISLLAEPVERSFRMGHSKALTWGLQAIELLETWNTHQQKTQAFDLLSDTRYIELLRQIDLTSGDGLNSEDQARK